MKRLIDVCERHFFSLFLFGYWGVGMNCFFLNYLFFISSFFDFVIHLRRKRFSFVERCLILGSKFERKL
ncbi:MAG: hypothetical protein RL757_2586 [Bacteroidota bacterium]|jgi:uncharacterized membrane protein